MIHVILDSQQLVEVYHQCGGRQQQQLQEAWKPWEGGQLGVSPMRRGWAESQAFSMPPFGCGARATSRYSRLLRTRGFEAMLHFGLLLWLLH